MNVVQLEAIPLPYKQTSVLKVTLVPLMLMRFWGVKVSFSSVK